VDAVIATRSELLARRSRTRLAEQGRDLLKDKRSALIVEFQQHRSELLSGLAHLRTLATTARGRLDDAVAANGNTVVASAALSAQQSIQIELTARSVAGVEVFDLTHDPLDRTPAERGWARVLVPERVHRAALAHERLLEAILDLGVMELSVRRLASEIARTTRQISALENVLLPSLLEEERFITLTLDEREREEHGRLRRARTQRAAR
jgi:V/A-type H+-transporting ATPase subunit D